MYVGQLKNLCEFDNPSTEMRNDVVFDYGLRDKGLTKIEVNPDGYPRTCYDMTLTNDGYNVKTVLVKILRRRSTKGGMLRHEVLTYGAKGEG